MKFALGAGVIVAGVGLLIATGIQETGQYFFTPSQLVERVRVDPTMHELGLKVGAKVVRGSVQRDDLARRVDFRISDGTSEFPVTYTGLVPDTFTDANDIEVIVQGKYGRDGVFRATEVLAKCGSRYESELDKARKT
ncbi:MAG: cytochrome c maturation protein CcmE [Gemmatimonadales bacterium]